jgi:hypothetical protein
MENAKENMILVQRLMNALTQEKRSMKKNRDLSSK